MTFVVPVRQAFRQVLGAITHVDGSARIQTVSAEDNRDFHALIAAFGQRTGIPIVLNTSYNNNAEPIVDSVDDAVITFLTTAIHVLFVGNWQVRKVERVVESDAFLDLVPSLAPCYRLARRTGPNGDVFAIEAVTSRYFVKRFAPVSTQLFQILAATDAISLRLHAARLQLSDAQSIGRLVAESYDLWAARMIRLHPVAASA